MIDAHHHLWDIEAREHRWLMGGQPWASDEELARLRRSFGLGELAPLAGACGVTGTVVIQTVAEPWETADLLALAAGGGLVAGVVGWTDLGAASVADAVAELRAMPGGSFLCGIRHPVLMEPDPGWLARPSVMRGLGALAAAGLCFDLVVRPDQLAAAVSAARSVPGLTFVLDHLGGPPVGSSGAPADSGSPGSWEIAIRELGALPNVACKLSGAHSDPPLAGDLRPYYEIVLAAFGPARLMFGSDWPVSSLAGSYRDICDLYRSLTADLRAAERDEIFDGTARRVYGLR